MSVGAVPAPEFRQRRRWLQGAGAAVSLGITGLPSAHAGLPQPAQPWAAFAAQSFGDAVGALGAAPDGKLATSALITLDVPAVADNGAYVPVTVTSALPGTREILLLVDGNPQPLAVRFDIPTGTEPFVATRLRMAASGSIYAAVRTDEGLFAAVRRVQVTVGGCA